MLFPPALRKLALTAHVTASVGWLGALAAFLALAATGLAGGDPERVRATYVAMDVVTRLVIVPLAVSALASGIVQALGTTWGLFRHYWVVVKLAVTLVAFAVLLTQLAPVASVADAAAAAPLGDELRAARLSLVVHGAGGLLVLLVPTVLSVYKPRGLTRYGAQAARLTSTR